MPDNSKKQEFYKEVTRSWGDESFVKLSMGDYRGGEADLKKIHAKTVLIKSEEKLSVTYQYKTKDIVKNYSIREADRKLDEWMGQFGAAHLTTTGFTLQLQINGAKTVLKKQESVTEKAALSHDKNKKRIVGTKSGYLHDLGITDANGAVNKTSQDKYRQINRYLEILEPLIKQLPSKQKLTVADMGSGKGYLTFVLYDYLAEILQMKVEVTGVETRPDMVDLCNNIARRNDLSGLSFVRSGISEYADKDLDILIALHACDTATDDAIYKGIVAGAELIVVAPCCHKEVRREMEKSKKDNDLQFLTRNGIFMERQAEMTTDGLRALLLQYEGYSTKVFEFISPEHTAKNIMITAIKNPKLKKHDTAILKEIRKAMDYFGIGQQHLAGLLKI